MLKNKERVERELITINGTLRFKRTLLVPADGESAKKLSGLQPSKSVCPLDMQLGISGLPFKITVQMMVAMAKEAVRASSYRRAADIIRERYGVDVSEKTVRTVTDFVAEAVVEDCRKSAEEARLEVGRRVDKRKKHRRADDILYLEMDGAMFNTRRETEDDNNWRECKIGIAFLSSDIKAWRNQNGELRREITKKRLTGYIGYYREFQYHLLSIASKYQYQYRSRIVIISDGADWIHKIRDELFPASVHIIDLSHVKQHVNEYGKWLHGDTSEAREWIEKINGMIESSKTMEVLKILEEHKDKKHPKGVTNLYKYIDERKNGMDYKAYRDSGLFVGSGASESANKYVMQNRMKLQGMRWSVSRGQGMLSLKCLYESENWGEVEPLVEARCSLGNMVTA